MRKLKLLIAACALTLGCMTVNAETDYTSLMSSNWTNSNGDFGGGKERYQTANYTQGQILYQSFTAPAAGIYEIKFYAVTSSTSGRGFNNIFGDNIAQAYAKAGSNKATVAMTVINQTGCTLVQDANIRTLSVEAAQGETIEYGLENIATGGNWYTIKELSAKMKTVAEIFQSQYDEAYAIWQYSTENEDGARATFKSAVDALGTALTGTLAEAQAASDALAAALVTYESKSYPVKGSGVKYDFTSKMNMAINAWTCNQGNGPAQYGFTGATETYGNTNAGEVMYQTITGLANGEYEIHFYAVANAANGGGVGGTKAIVFANDKELEIDVITQNSCTPSDYERTFTVMVKDGTIKYGIKNNVAAGNWYICKNVALYMTGAPDLSDYYDAIAANIGIANGYTGQKMGPTVSSNLADAISGAAGYQSITVIGTLESINQALIDANAAASASIADYANLQTAISAASTNYAPLTTNAATAYNDAIAAAQTVYDNASVDDCTETINSLTTAMQTANVSDYTYVTNTYPYAVNLGTWTTSNAVERNSQHWDGTSTSTYSEQYEGWGSTSWSCSYSQDLALPAGKYVFKVAGRKSSEAANLTLTVKQGSTIIGTLNNFPSGDTGKGIDISGAANFGDGTFAKNPNHTNDDLVGCGWQWRFVEFELSTPTTVNVAVTADVANAQYQWVGFCNATVQTDDADNVALMTALVALNDAKTAATLTKTTANVGDGVFQINETEYNSLWDTYFSAKSNADAYALEATSTAAEVEALTLALTTAQANYQNFMNNPTLNAPAADKRYYLNIVDGGQAWDGYAITFKAGDRGDDGLYNTKYEAPANVNLNQALKFTAVEGEANTYKVSGIRVENGGEQYLTTKLLAYGNGAHGQLRTTDDATKAMRIKIQPTTIDGQFKLLNVEANAVIARNASNPDNGVYTDGDANFTIAEAAQASIAINTSAAGYGTTILPFAAEIPTGVKAYTCEAYEGELLTLVEATAIEANKPYIIEGAWNDTKEGWGSGAALENKVGLLTGVYAETDAPVDSYVMQKHGTKVGFFKVADGKQPKVGANHCYVTASASARAFFFSTEATGIKAIESLTSGEAQIFNTNGAQLPALQKGINIIRKSNGESYKVMVK